MKPGRFFLTRTLALFLTLCLALPAPVFALRPAEIKQQQAGLEQLEKALGVVPTATGLEERNRLAEEVELAVATLVKILGYEKLSGRRHITAPLGEAKNRLESDRRYMTNTAGTEKEDQALANAGVDLVETWRQIGDSSKLKLYRDLLSRQEVDRIFFFMTNGTWKEALRRFAEPNPSPLPAAGLEEGVTVEDRATGQKLLVTANGVRVNGYTTTSSHEVVPAELMDVLEPAQERILVPLANIPSSVALLIQRGILSDLVIRALEAAHVNFQFFDLEDVPQLEPDPSREFVYVMNVPIGSEREWVLNPVSLILNFRSAAPDGYPETPRELGAFINIARKADGMVLRITTLYRSKTDIIALGTQV